MAEMPDPVRRLCEMAEEAADFVYVLTNLTSPPGSRPKNLDNAISAVREHYARAQGPSQKPSREALMEFWRAARWRARMISSGAADDMEMTLTKRERQALTRCEREAEGSQDAK